jgi:hypothetical protein
MPTSSTPPNSATAATGPEIEYQQHEHDDEEGNIRGNRHHQQRDRLAQRVHLARSCARSRRRLRGAWAMLIPVYRRNSVAFKANCADSPIAS